jgi:hypothetical protein
VTWYVPRPREHYALESRFADDTPVTTR